MPQVTLQGRMEPGWPVEFRPRGATLLEAVSGPRVQAGKASICPQETLLLLGRQSAHMGQVAD